MPQTKPTANERTPLLSPQDASIQQDDILSTSGYQSSGYQQLSSGESQFARRRKPSATNTSSPVVPQTQTYAQPVVITTPPAASAPPMGDDIQPVMATPVYGMPIDSQTTSTSDTALQTAISAAVSNLSKKISGEQKAEKSDSEYEDDDHHLTTDFHAQEDHDHYDHHTDHDHSILQEKSDEVDINKLIKLPNAETFNSILKKPDDLVNSKYLKKGKKTIPKEWYVTADPTLFNDRIQKPNLPSNSVQPTFQIHYSGKFLDLIINAANPKDEKQPESNMLFGKEVPLNHIRLSGKLSKPNQIILIGPGKHILSPGHNYLTSPDNKYIEINLNQLSTDGLFEYPGLTIVRVQAGEKAFALIDGQAQELAEGWHVHADNNFLFQYSYNSATGQIIKQSSLCKIDPQESVKKINLLAQDPIPMTAVRMRPEVLNSKTASTVSKSTINTAGGSSTYSSISHYHRNKYLSAYRRN